MGYFSFKARSVITELFLLFTLVSLFQSMSTTSAFAQTKLAPCRQGQVCSFTVASHTAVAQTGGTGALTVQKVWTRDGNGHDKATFIPGDAIQYALYVNNSSSSTITASFHFEDYWGTINDGVLQIMDHIFQNVSVPAGGTTGYYTPTTVPKNALPGSFTDRVIVTWDQNNQLIQAAGFGSFTVIGSKNIGVPYYSQFEESLKNNECGPTSVAMVLNYYKKGPGGTKGQQIAAIRKVIGGTPNDTTIGKQLEYALSHYGASSSEISQDVTGLPIPDDQIGSMAAAIQQGLPVIAFLNGSYLPGHKSTYGGHWLVVTGFSSDGTNNYVIVNDPDSTFSGGLPGHTTSYSLSPSLSLSPFGQAVLNGKGLEPNDIAGIIVAS